MGQQSFPTFRNAYDLFMLDCEARRLTTDTLRYYEDRLTAFIRWTETQSVQRVHELTPHHIKAYMIQMQRRNLAGYTLLAAYRAIRRFNNFFIEEGWIAENPMRKLKPPQVDREVRRVFTVAEVQTILVTCQTSRERALVLFLVDTGLRLAEVAALNQQDIDIKLGTVRVVMGKRRKGRVAFMGKRTRKAILRYYLDQWNDAKGAGSHTPVWVSQQTHERLTKTGIAQILKRLGRRADVPKVTAHAFRRTHATFALRAGVPVPVLQKTMGHEDLPTLMYYLGLTEDDLRDAHSRFGAVDSILK